MSKNNEKCSAYAVDGCQFSGMECIGKKCPIFENNILLKDIQNRLIHLHVDKLKDGLMDK